MLWLARRTGSIGWHSCVTFHIAAHRITTSEVPSVQTAAEAAAHVHGEEEIALLFLGNELAAYGETLERGL